MDTLRSISRDLVHAARSLAKARGFTLVCVISLGIGMGALVALATFTRMIAAPARGINTNGLVELLVLPLGPLRAKAGVWALEQWSYPDYRALRDTETGMALTGWTRESSQFGVPVPDEAALPSRRRRCTCRPTTSARFGVSLARGPGFDPPIDDATSAEARVILSDDFWRSRMSSDPDIVGKSVTLDGVPHTVVGIAPDDFRGHFHFFQAPGSLLFLPLERHPRLRRESESSRRQERRIGCASTAGSTRAWTSCRRMRWSRQPSRAWRSASRDERIQGGHGRAVHLDGRGRPSGEPARDQRSC